MWTKMLPIWGPALKERGFLFLFYVAYAFAAGATVFVAALAYYLTDSKIAAAVLAAIGVYFIVRHLPAVLFGGWEKRRRAFDSLPHSA